MTTTTVSTPVPAPGDAPRKTAKRDELIRIEAWAQAQWAASKPFEADAPAPGTPNPPAKFLGTFPFPYMNGRLHLGHSFSLSKVEFAMGFERLRGKVTLFPFGFHCTGMPIKACADKLTREVELFGQNFETYRPEDLEEEKADESTPQGPAVSDDPTKYVKKHGKAVAKSSGAKYQFQIMESMGVPREEIHKFADATHWLYYFPPLAKQDLIRLGTKIDWRRSFITTDINPYYDSFIRWQFNRLRKLNKIKFGERYTIFSAVDGQACMDHDRASGEGVGVQEYTGIKIQVLISEIHKEQEYLVKGAVPGAKLLTKEFTAAVAGRSVFLVAATLRPETMYGQTNCFVGPDLEYGAYAANNKEVYIISERSAKNMAWQSLFGDKDAPMKKGDLSLLATFKGWDLVGVPLKAPLTKYPFVYCLPMDSVLASKGTGVVTSVPSDSPDDFMTLTDLAKKTAYYHIHARWVEPFLPPIPIIETATYGNLAAVKAVELLKIRSPKDKALLQEAKEAVYREGFYSGKMCIGDFAGKTVQEAKPLIKAQLVQQGLAFTYCEPENLVVSRSGDECVVSLMDQWYLDYGEDAWKAKAFECLAQLETFSSDTRNGFTSFLNWLKEWACSRSFGLGSKLPWDKQWLIESLSDSTIYMAYYTVCGMLQANPEQKIDGSVVGAMGIKASDLTDQVWDYILVADSPLPVDSALSKVTLDRLKHEFNYFYPMDLRVSGKDLIGNHLTFCIYNHVALFPKTQWPLAIRVNGHLLLNSEKMSKSSGNFMTLSDSLDEFGADATRFTLADAGDTTDDANFMNETANNAILKLFTQLEWITEVSKSLDSYRTGPLTHHDEVFAAEMDRSIGEAHGMYASMMYREALRTGFYDFQAARDWYREVTNVAAAGAKPEGYHRNLIVRFVESQALLLAPFTPHWSEWVWMKILNKPTSIMSARWPAAAPTPNQSLLGGVSYIRGLTHDVRRAEDAQLKSALKKLKKAGGKVDPAALAPAKSALKMGRIIYSKSWPAWQLDVVQILTDCWSAEDKALNGKEMRVLKDKGFLKDKRILGYVAQCKTRMAEQSLAGLADTQLFDEHDTILQFKDYIERSLGLHTLDVFEAQEVLGAPGKQWNAEDVAKAEAATPGSPQFRSWTE